MAEISGSLNRLGFVFNAAPVLANVRLLTVTFRVRQAADPAVTLLEQAFSFDLPVTGKAWQYADGITLRVN
jgi:hypothetical protein